MRAGRLHHCIKIESPFRALDDYGVKRNVSFNPNIVATLRAELINPTREEFARAYGQDEEHVLIFRTRFVDGVTTADTVRFDGRAYDIKQVVEIGRRKALELRTVLRTGQ
jgi:SPP1 family predicted phage head-tail adaptor